MRIPTKLAITVAALLLMMGSACEEDPSSRELGALKPMGKLPNLEDVNERDPTRKDYIQATIDLGCLAQAAVKKDLRYGSMTEANRNIMTKNRFRDRKHYTEMHATMRQDHEARVIIQVGIQKCLGTSIYKNPASKP